MESGQEILEIGCGTGKLAALMIERGARVVGINDFSDLPMSYAHGFGWEDANGDGINDNYVDADGDGVNDLTGHGYMSGFVKSGTGESDETPGDDGWPSHGHGMGLDR